jgi:hypothetical protein
MINSFAMQRTSEKEIENPLAKFELRRTLTFRIRDRLEKGDVYVGNIAFRADKGKWVCHWSIAFIHPEVFYIFGNDPLDALISTLDFLTSLIRGSERDGLVVWWRSEGDHGGFAFGMVESKHWEGLTLEKRE